MESASSLPSIFPSWNIEIPSMNSYRLSAIVYLGSYHFTARLVLENGSVWKYDGKSNNGIPIFEFGAQKTDSELSHFLSLDE